MKFKGIMAFVIGRWPPGTISAIQWKRCKLAFSSVSANYFAGGPNFGTKLTNAYDGDPATLQTMQLTRLRQV